jgi:L-2-hydroxyglutarate oxidase LhgO
MERVDVVIIGAGLIGLSISRRLHQLGKKCVLLERNIFCGMETSSRNSEVIHSGIYYPTNSCKASFCVDGRFKLLQYVSDRKIFHSMCGKLIVGHDKEDDKKKLQQLYQNGLMNGLSNIKLLSEKDIRVMEPNLSQAIKHAIFLPYTGIVDSHELMQSFQVDIQEANQYGESSMILTDCSFRKASIFHGRSEKLFHIESSRGDILSTWLINAAGLLAPQVAFNIESLQKQHLPKSYYAKGSYFKLSRDCSNIFSRLIYPLPVVGGLGVHLTLDKMGSVKFGPDVEWLRPAEVVDVNDPYLFDVSIPPVFDLSVSVEKLDNFYQSISSFWSDVAAYELIPDYSGVRPKTVGPQSSSLQDFTIQSSREHHVEGLINLFGIESPGLTSCLSIADHVGEIIRK